MNNLLFIQIQLKSLLIVILWSLTPHAQSCFIFSFLMYFFSILFFSFCFIFFSGREERGPGMNCLTFTLYQIPFMQAHLSLDYTNTE